MLTKIKTNNPHFNTYYQDNSLLIQFVILEFMSTFNFASHIQSITDQCFESEKSLEQFIPTLSDYFHKLLGTFSDHDRPGSTWTKGPLTKLRNFCCQFSKNRKEENNLILYTSVHQTWISALHNLEILNASMHSHSENINLLIIKRNLNYFFTRLNSISKHLPRVLTSFYDNENVMFFLFRKKDQLAEVYGPHFLKKLFKASVKQSTHKQDTIQLLMQRYIKRGFGHMISTINFS